MLVLGYPLTFGLRSFATAGRATRVHFAAAPGASLLWASAGYALLHAARSQRGRTVVIASWAAMSSLSLAFGLRVQQDYVKAWENQAAFWADLIAAVPDAGEGTTVLIDPLGLADTREIDSNTWNLPRVLEQLYKFPDEWRTPPRVYRLLPGWERRIVTEDCRFRLDNLSVTAPPSLYGVADPQEVILLRVGAGGLERAGPDLAVGECSLELRPASPPVLPELPTQVLYRLMLEGERR
jgi:hypothetical protein